MTTTRKNSNRNTVADAKKADAAFHRQRSENLAEEVIHGNMDAIPHGATITAILCDPSTQRSTFVSGPYVGDQRACPAVALDLFTGVPLQLRDKDGKLTAPVLGIKVEK